MLAGRHHLPGFGVPGSDDGFVVGAQFDVVELILGLIDRRPGLVEGGLSGLEVGLGDVQLGLRTDPAIEQFLLAAGVGLGVDQLRLDPSQIALGRTQLVLLVSGVKRCEQGALLDFGADIDVTAGDATRHAETDITFIAGLDAAGEAAETFLVQCLDLDRQHRAYRFRWRFFFRTGHQHSNAEHQHQTLHGWAPAPKSLYVFSAISTFTPGCSNWPPAMTTFSPPLRPALMTTLPMR
ncbi:hypothetical protein D3C84_700540 [compost metagenome]